MALADLYSECEPNMFADSPSIETDPDIFTNAARVIYDAGRFDASMIADPAIRTQIEQTFNAINTAIDEGIGYDVPAVLRYALENNAFIFSGFKTYHSMRELGLSLLTDKGDIKPFNKFLDDALAINAVYNKNYLFAEYKHAVAASQMALRWHEFQKDGDRYNLQYRTAADSRVREEHALLHNTTLPVDDPFWDSFFPPNGWGCRCTAVQVRKSKYPLSDRDLAMKRGNNCTDSAKKKIFRYNPGKSLQLFPPKHPYYKVPNADKAIIVDQARYLHNKACFERLRIDKDFSDVHFDAISGGVKATHKGHCCHDSENAEIFFGYMKPADLERECIDLLFRWGHRAILRDEFANRNLEITPPSLDLEIDGNIMDIRSITKGGPLGYALNAKNRQLANVYKKTGLVANAVCLHFHDPSMFSEEKFLTDAKWFSNMLRQKNCSQRIKHVFVVINGAPELKIYHI